MQHPKLQRSRPRPPASRFPVLLSSLPLILVCPLLPLVLLFAAMPAMATPVVHRAAVAKSEHTEPVTPPPKPKTVAFSTHLLAPFFNAYYLDANIRASNSFGVIINTSYLILEHEGWKTKTGTLGAGLSYYFQGQALRRWYVEANSELMLSSWRHQPSGKNAPIVPGVTVNALLGYRFIWELGPVLDLGAGGVMLHFPSARVDTESGPLSSKAFTKVYPTIKLNVGWAF